MKSSFSKVNLTLVVASVMATALMALSCQKSGVGLGFRSPDVSFNPSASEFTEVTADCVKSLSNTPLNAGGQTLWLGVYESPWPVDEGQTKSAPVTAVHNTFEVSGYGYMGDWNTQNKANLFFKQTMTKSGSSWTGETDMRWPGSDYKVRFAAVSPAVANTSNLSWTSTATTAGNPVISYTVNNAVASQLDLLECVTDVADGSGSSVPASGVAMTFQHALTAVTFKVSDFGVAGTVKSVTIEDVYNSGSHVVGSDSWTGQSGSADYSLTGLNQAFSASGDVAVTTGANTLLLMPQTCPAGSKITVVMTIGGKDRTLESSIAGHTWAPGKNVTYVIKPSNDDWLFSMVVLSSVPESVTSGSATNVATVKSFRQHALGFKEALPWTVQYSTDGGSSYSGTKPSWLTAISPVSGDGGWAGETINATATRASSAEHRVKVKVCNSGDSKTFDIVMPELGPFAGLHIASGNLYKTADGWAIAPSPLDGLETFASKYGASTTGSYYFSFLEMGALFEKAGFATSDGSIENLLDPLDGWRLPTRAEWCTLTTGASPGTSRNGSSVSHGGGNASGVKYYKVLIDLTGSAYASKGQSIYSTDGTGTTTFRASNYQAGLLLFPDNASISTTYTFPTAANTTDAQFLATSGTGAMTYAQFTDLLDQGCAFLPASGYRIGENWNSAGGSGYCWSSTQGSAKYGCYLFFYAHNLNPSSDDYKSNHLPVRLVR